MVYHGLDMNRKFIQLLEEPQKKYFMKKNNFQENRHLQSLRPWVKHAQIGGRRQFHFGPVSKVPMC